MILAPTTPAMRATMIIVVVEGAMMTLLPGGVIMTDMEEEATVEATKTGRGDTTAVAGVATTRRGTTTGATRRCLHSTACGRWFVDKVACLEASRHLKAFVYPRFQQGLGKVRFLTSVSDSLRYGYGSSPFIHYMHKPSLFHLPMHTVLCHNRLLADVFRVLISLL